MSTDQSTLTVEREGPVLVLTMNRPDRGNILNQDMVIRLADAWDLIDGDDGIRCAILTGAGDTYCAGGDLAGGPKEERTETERRLDDDRSLLGKGLLLTRWVRKPVIAAVNGACLGGGCEMLQQTDIRVAEEHATFGVPEAARGLIAGAGTTMRLKRQIPYTIAMEMLLAGRILTAAEALQWGLVGHVVPTGQALATAREIAAAVAAAGPLAVLAAKSSAVETGWAPEDEARYKKTHRMARTIIRTRTTAITTYI